METAARRFTLILWMKVATKTGMRDIAQPSGIHCDNQKPDADEMELYWDIILLTESQFLLPTSGPGTDNAKRNIKKLQKYTVNKIGESLNQIVKLKKHTLDERTASWRKLGLRYTLVYLPLHFKDVIWCKSDGIYFHVILPRNDLSIGDRRQTNEKEWLLALLELANALDLQFMRLYIRRDDFFEVSTFLRNLNWIGGILVPNEDRNIILNKPTKTDNSGFDDLLLGDENFIILEFEC